MARASYRFGVEWIAMNDDAGSMEAMETDADHEERVAGYISTGLLADLFGKTAESVARDIVRKRKQLRNEGQL